MSQTKYVIVVGVDYSGASDLAFEQALAIASGQPHAELHVVYVKARVSARARSVESATSNQDAARDLQAYVAQRVSAFQARSGKVPFERLFDHLRSDEPGHQIAQLAADVEADLVVVGTHDRSGVPRLLLGSVAEAVTRLSPCPVLIVRPKAIPAAMPAIEPPCPRCVDVRFATQGAELWCEQHRERHGQRHTYHQGDRASAETNFPLI